MKTFDQIREGFVSAAQRRAVWASKADGGKGHPDNKKKKSKKEDTEKLDEISPELMTRYAKKAIPQQFKKHQDARSGGHNYMTKTGGDDKAKKSQAQADRRKKGIDSVRKRMDPKDKGQSKTGRASRPQGGLRPGKGSSYQVNPSKVGGFKSKYLDQ